MFNHLLRTFVIVICLTGCGSGGNTDFTSQPTSATRQSQKKSAPPLVVSAASDRGPSILAWEKVEALPEQIAVFDHVFWEPDDTGVNVDRALPRGKKYSGPCQDR